MLNQEKLYNTERRDSYSILVKPTAMCNLNCEYCYDLPMRERLGNCKMSREIVEHIADLVNKHTKRVQWIWHGGEATMMGREWFEDIQDVFDKRYATEFTQNVQSNGLNFARDYGWIGTLNKTGINPGISYDGFTQEVRVGSTQDDMTKLIKDYEKKGVSLGTISVINKKNVDKMIDMYEQNKKDFGADFGGAFNVIFKAKNTESFGLELTCEEYAPHFKSFVEYLLNDLSEEASLERTVRVTISNVTGSMDNVCCTNTDCRLNWIGVNADGTIYPCDRYLEKYEIGNIMDFESIEEIYMSENFQRYYKDIATRFDTYCKECLYYKECNGGCNANHVDVDGSVSSINETDCEIFKSRFDIVYFALQDLDTDSVINHRIACKLVKDRFISVREISKWLGELGYEIDLHIDSNSVEVGKLQDTPQFKLFRIFNPYRGTANCGHTDFVNYDYRLDIDVIAGSQILKQSECSRREIFTKIYQDKHELIDTLIMEVLHND